MQSSLPTHDNLDKWLEFISEPSRRLATHHIGEYFTYITGRPYLNTKKECSESFRKWYDYYQGIHPKQFIPIKTWINEFLKKNDYVIQYYNTDFGYTFVFFTKEEWYVRKR